MLRVVENSLKCRAPQDIDKNEMEALRRVGMENPNRYRIDYAKIHRAAGWFWTRIDNQCGKEGRWFVPKKEEENADNSIA